MEFRVALAQDIVRLIEHHQDLNPGFPPPGGRTALARVRTHLAHLRLAFSRARTVLAQGRTGLAFLRTGISFVTIALILLRVFGAGVMLPLEALLIVAGAVMIVDGLRWYLPARSHEAPGPFRATEPTGGTTVLQLDEAGGAPLVRRSAPAAGAAGLRAGWGNLSPVMRRRFLASDRTDLAEERTALASLRTAMARARSGLAFTRTGIAFIGLGLALLRQFGAGPWRALDAGLIAVGLAMTLEGFFWYFPGRRAGRAGLRSVQTAEARGGVWELFFPPAHAAPAAAPGGGIPPCLRHPCRPGIWGTTGLALERTVLAERRNVMARLRTVMARSRTGLAFVRTGMSISAVGLGLLAYFGAGSGWTAFDCALVALGLALVADGLWWHLPAERLRRQLPYCFGELEIALPDYGRPAAFWKRVRLAHGDV